MSDTHGHWGLRPTPRAQARRADVVADDVVDAAPGKVATVDESDETMTGPPVRPPRVVPKDDALGDLLGLWAVRDELDDPRTVLRGAGVNPLKLRLGAPVDTVAETLHVLPSADVHPTRVQHGQGLGGDVGHHGLNGSRHQKGLALRRARQNLLHSQDRRRSRVAP